MKRRGLVFALAACLILAGCAAPEEDGAPKPGRSILGEASGLSEEEPLLTVDGREIPAWQYLYWLAFTCGQLQARYQEAGAVLDWDAPAEGGTLADYAKQQALADTVLYATVDNWAEAYRCPLDEEGEAAIKAHWAEEAEACGGESACLAELAQQGLTRARWEVLEETGQLYAKLCQLYEAQEGPFQRPAPEPEERITIDRLLISAGEDREAARERIAEIFSRLNAAADQAAEFTALAAVSDDPAGPRAFTPGSGTFSASLEEAALSLEPGQFSGILESEEGFSILRRLDDEAAAPAEAPRVDFDEFLQSAAEKAEVETAAAYARINPAVFLESLQNARSEWGDSSR